MMGVDGKGAASPHCVHVALDQVTRPVYVTLHHQVFTSRPTLPTKNRLSVISYKLPVPHQSHHLLDERDLFLPGTAVLSCSFHLLLSHVGRTGIAIAVLSGTDVAANRMHST